MVAYPLVAAIDAIIRAVALSPAARPRLMAIIAAARDLRPHDDLVSPNVVAAAEMDVLQACVGLAAPLRVCELFLPPALTLLFASLPAQRRV
ncbi:hypothetical protein NEMBOFW57_008136 [Staphylotrichum longicolle]|uniref:Uncharacterized protein n=1 Tax=Staphylotrichum longicolle TaxID=669026 RepID=A0AAD4HVK9_9PEZI|nr:hypothetical protein NEMBOFW57_008136 [Staphylotrichum longicolle]